MMKKTLALLLAVLMVMSCTVFTAVAEEAEATGVHILPVSTGAGLTQVTHPNPSFSADALVDEFGYWDGDNKAVSISEDGTAVAQSFDGVVASAGGAFKVRYISNRSYDISNMKKVCFDLYVSNIEAVYDDSFEIELRSSKGKDNAELRHSTTLMGYSASKALVSGWNHFEILLSSLTSTDTNPNDDATLDLTDWCYFRIFNSSSTEIGLAGETTTMMIKNLYFSDDETLNVQNYGANGEDIYVDAWDSSNSGKLNASTGSGNGLKYTTGGRALALDISKYDALDIDVWIENVALNAASFFVEMTSSAKSDHEENNRLLTLQEFAGRELTAGEWNTISIPFYRLTGTSNGECDYTSWDYLRIFNQSSASYTETTEYQIKLRMPRLVRYEETHLVWDMDSVNPHSVGFSNDTSNYAHKSADIDGDGDNEWVVVQTPETAASGKMGRGGGYNNNGNGIKSRIDFGTKLEARSDFEGILFDIYVSSGAVGSSESSLTGSILDQNFEVEFSNSSSGDTYEVHLVNTLKNLFGGHIVEDQWVTVGFALDHATPSSKTDGGVVQGEYDRAAGTKYIRIYNSDDFYYEGGITIAIDNIRAVRDYGDAEELAVPGATDVITMENGSSLKWVPAQGSCDIQNKTVPIMIMGVPGSHAVSRVGYGSFSAVDVSNMEKMCFDLYLGLYDTNANGTFIQTMLEATPVELELRSTNHDDNERTWRGVCLNDLLTEKITDFSSFEPGWYSAEIDLNKYTVESSFDAKAAAYISMYNLNAVSVPQGAAAYIVLDNLYFVDADYVAPEEKEALAVSGAQLALSDAFSLIYSSKGDETINTNVIPVMDFAIGDSVTRVNAITTDEQGKYTYPIFDSIYAHRLADTVSTTVWGLNNEHALVKSTHTYSVKNYAANWLELDDATILSKEEFKTDEQVAAFKALLSATLRYGAAAQTYAAYNTEDLATDGVNGLTAAPVFDVASVSKVENILSRDYNEATDAYKWRGATLVLGSAMALRYSFTADSVEGLTVTYTDGENTYTVDSFATGTATDGTAYYYFDIPVYAYEFDTVFTASFDGADGADGYDMSYAVNHYVATKYDPMQIKTSALLEAIYNYGVAADAYVAAVAE